MLKIYCNVYVVYHGKCTVYLDVTLQKVRFSQKKPSDFKTSYERKSKPCQNYAKCHRILIFLNILLHVFDYLDIHLRGQTYACLLRDKSY